MTARAETFKWEEAEMSQREAIEAALAAWREADRRLASAVDREKATISREVEQYRAAFQQLSAIHMVERIGMLQAAESRRAHATPSTVAFHEAARETQEIASEIWEAARHSDEDTPETEANKRTTPRPNRPGARAVGARPDGAPAPGTSSTS